MNKSLLYNMLFNYYGVEKQTMVAIEELNECAAALTRNLNSRGTAAQVIDELADVEIMCEQMRIIYGSTEVESRKNFKLARISERLEHEQKNRNS